MKIFSVDKVVKVYAEVKTDIGEFRVFEDGKVLYWDAAVWEWDTYQKYDMRYDEIKEAGLRVFYHNKGE